MRLLLLSLLSISENQTICVFLRSLSLPNNKPTKINKTKIKQGLSIHISTFNIAQISLAIAQKTLHCFRLLTTMSYKMKRVYCHFAKSFLPLRIWQRRISKIPMWDCYRAPAKAVRPHYLQDKNYILMY